MSKIATPRYILSAFALILLVALFVLTATHDSYKCRYSSDEKNTWGQCDDDYKLFCTSPAVELQGEIDGTLLLKKVYYNLVCPWRTGTNVMSYIALIMATLFTITILLTSKTSSMNLGTGLTVMGGLTGAGLLTSFVLMIVDTVDGKNGLGSTNGFSTLLQTSQAAYVWSIILIAFLMGLIISLTILAFRTHYKGLSTPLAQETTTTGHYNVYTRA